jgi:hypothetical protein|tara:strand:- start:552 stop:731 length:180 start_codon:yes stop_codon:yes gene_type:complete
MTFRILDDNKKQVDHKENDDSFLEFTKENENNSTIDYVKKIRNKKGELIVWEIHYKDLD